MSRDAFTRCVVDAFEQMVADPYLAGSPLAGALTRPGGSSPAVALRELLLHAIESLRPAHLGPGSALALRRYRHMVMRYVDGADVEQICRALIVSGRQARRDHREALDALSEHLWQQYLQLHAENAAPTDESPSGDDGAPARARSDLEAELDLLAPEPVPELAALPEVAASALATVGRLADGRGVRCHLDMPPTLTAPVNRSVTRQTLVHLLALAIDQEGAAAVSLRGDEEGRTARVTVTVDAAPTGPGFERLLEPGSPLRLDDRLRAAGHLVEMVGGTLELRPSARNGLAIVITLPSIRPAVVLAIDDNPDMLRLMQRYLAGSGYRLLTATTAEKALELAATARPDVVLLDVLMPSQDGWEVLESIRQHPASKDVPVIVCSVLREQGLAQSLGADDFLMKPITQRALLTALARHASAAATLPGSP
jgi:CheY-like chemotaxis protein